MVVSTLVKDFLPESARPETQALRRTSGRLGHSKVCGEKGPSAPWEGKGSYETTPRFCGLDFRRTVGETVLLR